MNNAPRRRLLPGISAYIWGVALFVFAIAGMILVTGYILLSLIAGISGELFSGDSAYRNFLFLFAVAGVLPGLGFALRIRLELENGYTTNPLKDPQVALCDWKTGSVLRDVNEPLTGWKEYRRRLHKVRAEVGDAERQV